MSKSRKRSTEERLSRPPQPEREARPRPSSRDLRQGTYVDFAETVALDEAAYWKQQQRETA